MNMELRQYLAIFKKHFWAISLFGVVGAVTAFVFVARLPSGVRLEQLFYIVPPASPKEDTYNFEGYFRQEKARNVTDTVVAILGSADFAQTVVVPPEAVSVHKIAPQLISIAVTSSQQENAKILLEKAVLSFNQKMADLVGFEQAVQLKPVANNPLTASVTQNKFILVIFGAVAGITFALFVVGLKTYFKL